MTGRIIISLTQCLSWTEETRDRPVLTLQLEHMVQKQADALDPSTGLQNALK